MEKSVDKQIEEVKNNIRYICKKYRWENYEIGYHHKHHHSQPRIKFDEKQQNYKNKHHKVMKHKIHEQKKRKKKLAINEIGQKDEIETFIQEKVEQSKEHDFKKIENKELVNPNEEIINETNTNIVSQKNRTENNQKKEVENVKENLIPDQELNNKDTKKRICLYSSDDDDSDSNFDFKEFQQFFKVQDDLYHLTKHVKHGETKKRKPKSIILSSNSDSDSFISYSSYDLEDYQFKNDIEKRKHVINYFIDPIETKDKSTNTIQIEYSSADTQTTSRGIRYPNKKIKFSAQLKANVKHSLHSFLSSSSSSKSNSNSGNYSSSRGSYGNSTPRITSIKNLSEQYASSENESSKGSNKCLNNKKNSFGLTSKSTQASLNDNVCNTKKITNIENSIALIEEEEEEVDGSNDLKLKQSSSKIASINKNEKLQKQKVISNNQIDKNNLKLSETEENRSNKEQINQLINNTELSLSSKSSSNYSKNENLENDNSQEEDIEKLIEEVSQISSKMKKIIKKSKIIKKKPKPLKTGSTETDENTEAYSQIPSEFSDNIGVDSNLGSQLSQINKQSKSDEIIQAKTASNVLKLEGFMEQSDNIPISTKLENEFEEPKKKYNNYGSSSDSPINAPS